MTKNKKDILWRIYLVYLLTCLFCLAIIGKIVMIQFVEGEELRGKSKTLSRRIVDIQAVRGNIYDYRGSMLATSLPIYEVRMDLNSDALTDEVFNEHIDSLCIQLADFFKTKTALDYKVELVTARRKGARYHLIKRNVRHNELKIIKTFPLFRKGKFKGGFICIQRNKREKPFRMLAHRTIGYSRENAGNVGVEGAFDEELKGVSGSRLMQKISGGVWKPINDENEIQPQDGYDVYTTIDINIQDLAYEALLRQLEKQEADHGCVVVMEVKTGEIKAISNLSKGTTGKYYEKYNYAIGERDEPGSTFKLASVIALLEDGHVEPNDSIDAEEGSTWFYDRKFTDSHKGGHGTISVQQAFELSSNIGIAKLIEENYGKNPEKFIAQLQNMHLDKKTGIEILGEETPVIIDVNGDGWSGTTLPSMAIGYSTQFSPLQILTLYNAVANSGEMVKPRLVNKISDKGKLVKQYYTEVLEDKICSKSTIEKVQKMLEGVVEQGTAEMLKSAEFKIAGKTGTAKISVDGKYVRGKYRASFVGYFPADNPKYSCIVVVSEPSRFDYYGASVAGPIFKEIANKIYSRKMEFHNELAKESFKANSGIPYSKSGSKEDIITVFENIGVALEIDESASDWVVSTTNKENVLLENRKIITNLVPNVVGMGLRDAVYLLENSGLIVVSEGRGVVKEQSIKPGVASQESQKIYLKLS